MKLPCTLQGIQVCRSHSPKRLYQRGKGRCQRCSTPTALQCPLYNDPGPPRPARRRPWNRKRPSVRRCPCSHDRPSAAGRPSGERRPKIRRLRPLFPSPRPGSFRTSPDPCQEARLVARTRWGWAESRAGAARCRWRQRSCRSPRVGWFCLGELSARSHLAHLGSVLRRRPVRWNNMCQTSRRKGFPFNWLFKTGCDEA